MKEETDVKSYLGNSRIKENVSAALDKVFQQAVLPYNPYTILLDNFQKNSEYYVTTKSHQQLGMWMLGCHWKELFFQFQGFFQFFVSQIRQH